MTWLRTWRRRINKIKSGSSYSSPLASARRNKRLATFALFGVVGFSLILTVLFAWYSRDLPTPDKVVRREGFSTKILDRDGQLLYDVFTDQQRTPVELADIPEDLKNATVAIEDKDFYKHEGFDLFGMVRGFSRYFTRGRAQGGSTLTQQLVKNVLLSSERTLPRKIKEFVLSVQIERKFSKDEILQMYLNEAPYGGTAWGVGTAAETYFAKDVNELSLVESAILAGMPQRPSIYTPYGSYPDAYVGRATDVLRRMREDGYITKEEEAEAVEALPNMEFKPPSVSIKAPHFSFYVKQELEEMYGETLVEQGGLKVTTSLDLDLQQSAQEIVTQEIEEVEDQDIGNGAAVVMDTKTGEILAMVGSKDFFADDYDGQVNVTLSLRQPGSAIKPITYVTAFKKGFTPSYMLMDTQTEFPGGAGNPPYIPANYDGEFRGPVQLRFALGSSLNIPAVKLLALVGIEDTLKTAYDMGFTSLEPTKENLSRFGLSLTLGGGEVRLLDMTTAYSAFSNLGTKVEPIAILKVEDKDGKTLFEHKQVKGKQVLDPSEAFLMNHVLSDNNARLLTFGANSYLNMGSRSIAVKTGTTNDRRDNWTVGWSQDTIVGVWVGNNDNTPMTNVASGVTGASPIWRGIMLEVLTIRPDKAWEVPNNVEAVLVDRLSGYPEHHGFPNRSEYVIKGTLPPLPDPIHAMLKLCKSSGKLATDVDIAKGDYDEKEYYVFKEDDPFSDSPNRWQDGIVAWLAGQGDEKYHPPTENCDSQNDVVIKVNNPKDQQNFAGNDIPIEIEITTGAEVDKVNILVDGSTHTSYTGLRINETINLSSGKHTIKVRVTLKNGNEAVSGDFRIGVGGVEWDEGTEPSPSP